MAQYTAMYREKWESLGRWTEFVGAREANKLAGMKPREAADKANYDLDAKYPEAKEYHRKGQEPPPEDAPIRPAAKAGAITLSMWAGRRQPTPGQEVVWVHENFIIENLIPQDAPSAGAWGLLAWAKDNESEFREIWKKLVPAKMETQVGDRFIDDGRTVDLLDEIELEATDTQEPAVEPERETAAR